MVKYIKNWVLIFWILMFSSIAIVFYLFFNPLPEESIMYRLLNGFSGNLIGEIIGGFLFLFLALYLDKNTEQKIDKIVLLTEKSEKLITERERLLKMEQKISRFKQFLEKESYYNIRFFGSETKQNSPSGLEYTIYPIKDPITKLPIKKETEMWSRYVVEIKLPSYFGKLNKEESEKYFKSPIRNSEYYFCSFYDGDWHLGNEEIGDENYKFYLSSKIGPVENGETANSFVNRYKNFLSDKELICTLRLNDDGTVLTGYGGYTPYKIYKDNKDNIFLQIYDSPLKRMFNIDTKGKIEFHIEDMIGYTANSEKIKNIQENILKILDDQKIDIKKVDYRILEDKIILLAQAGD